MVDVTEYYCGKNGDGGAYYDRLPKGNELYIVGNSLKSGRKIREYSIASSVDSTYKELIEQYVSISNFCRVTKMGYSAVYGVFKFGIETKIRYRNYLKIRDILMKRYG